MTVEKRREKGRRVDTVEDCTLCMYITGGILVLHKSALVSVLGDLLVPKVLGRYQYINYAGSAKAEVMVWHDRIYK